VQNKLESEGNGFTGYRGNGKQNLPTREVTDTDADLRALSNKHLREKYNQGYNDATFSENILLKGNGMEESCNKTD